MISPYTSIWLSNIATSISLFLCPLFASAQTSANLPTKPEVTQPLSVIGAVKLSPTLIEINLSEGRKMSVDFYSSNIFRLFRDDSGGEIRDPEATPEATILVEKPRLEVTTLKLSETEGKILILTETIRLELDKKSSLLTLSLIHI